jgi:hypothetical protein
VANEANRAATRLAHWRAPKAAVVERGLSPVASCVQGAERRSRQTIALYLAPAQYCPGHVPQAATTTAGAAMEARRRLWRARRFESRLTSELDARHADVALPA